MEDEQIIALYFPAMNWLPGKPTKNTADCVSKSQTTSCKAARTVRNV